MISKSAIIKAIIEELGRELDTLAGASRAMHEDASHEENRAEDKYDTRGLETAYLASSQARHATATEEALAAYNGLKPTKFDKQAPIDLTALVEAEADGERMFYFIGPMGGGIEVTVNRREIFVITPESPIGQKFMGKQVGHRFKLNTQGPGLEYQIVAVH